MENDPVQSPQRRPREGNRRVHQNHRDLVRGRVSQECMIINLSITSSIFNDLSEDLHVDVLEGLRLGLVSV